MRIEKLQIAGNLGSDAEVKEINSKKVLVLSVCCTRRFKRHNGELVEIPTWYKVEQWRESFNDNWISKLKKGTCVYIDGEPTVEAYINRDNKAAGVIKINADNIQVA